MSNPIRSFIAIPLTSQIHKNLADFTRSYGLNSREIGFKPVKSENIHLTLKFLGEIDQNLVHNVSQALDQITKNVSTFTASVRRIGAFPGWNNRARVIWVGVEPVETLRDIYHLIDDETAKIGIPSEGKAFSPHLTLARVSFMTMESENVFNRLKVLSPEPDFGEFSIDRIVLFKSVLLSQGPVYSILSTHLFSTL